MGTRLGTWRVRLPRDLRQWSTTSPSAGTTRPKGAVSAPTQLRLPGTEQLDPHVRSPTLFRLEAIAAARQRLWGEQMASAPAPVATAEGWGEVVDVTGSTSGERAFVQQTNAELSAAYELAADIAERAPLAVDQLSRHPTVLEVLGDVRAASLLPPLEPEALSQLLCLVEHVNVAEQRQLLVSRTTAGSLALVDTGAARAVLASDEIDAATSVGWLTPQRLELLSSLCAQGPETHGLGVTLQSLLRGERPRYRQWPGQVQGIFVLTANRPERLEATLRAYADNLRRHGREALEITVLDDASGDIAAKNVAIVERLRAEGVHLKYFGAAQKQAALEPLVAAVARRLDVAESDVRRRFETMFGGETVGADGARGWRSSVGRQRNWVSLLSVGSRRLVVDDDTKPGSYRAGVLPHPTSAHREQAASLSLSSTGAIVPRSDRVRRLEPLDIVGLAEAQPDGLVSASFSGHLDESASAPVASALFFRKSAAEALDGAMPLVAAWADGGAHFSSSTYVTPASTEGIAVAPIDGRNEDFLLAAVLATTSFDPGQGVGLPSQGGDARFVHYHQRGRRWANPAQAELQEGRATQTIRLVRELITNSRAPGAFDPNALARRVNLHLERHPPEWGAAAAAARSAAALRAESISEALVGTDAMLAKWPNLGGPAGLREIAQFYKEELQPDAMFRLRTLVSELETMAPPGRTASRRELEALLAADGLSLEQLRSDLTRRRTLLFDALTAYREVFHLARSDGDATFTAEWAAQVERQVRDTVEAIPTMYAAQGELYRGLILGRL